MDNQLERLYTKFRIELSKNDISIYYDEDEIVDIFDYAGDVHDDYIRLEALLLGNRLFPDSEALLQRRAIWLANIGNGALQQLLADHPQATPSAMWEILHIRAYAPYAPDVAVEELENFLRRNRLEDDETIIQFVALVRHLEQEEWLMTNLDMVRDHCEYPPTLLFEIARMAETPEQSLAAIPLLEELTELDPFNTDYWGLLAELQSNCDQYEESLSSLDYAKALEPDEEDLLTIEGYNYLKLNRVDDAINALQHALTVDEDFFAAKRNLLEAYRMKGDASKCAELLQQLFIANPTDVSLLCEMLITFPEKTNDTLTSHYTYAAPDENEVIVRASELCRTGNEDTALRYFDWYRHAFPLSTQGQMVYLELLYHNGRYTEAYDFLIENIKSPVLSPTELPVIAVIVSILLKLHIFDEAMHFCTTWLEKLHTAEVEHNSFRLINRGLCDILTDVRQLLLQSPEPTDEEIDRVVL